MEDLRLTFLVFGIVAIVAILVHGLWTIRKNAKGSDKPKFESRDWQNKNDPLLDDDEQFDDHGIGSVRVISTKSDANNDASNNPQHSNNDDTQNDTLHAEPLHAQNAPSLLASTENAQTSDDASVITPDDAAETPASTEPEQSNSIRDDEGEALSIDDGLSLESSEMDFATLAQEHEQEAPAPLYGSVVTQPKPGFHRLSRSNETAHRQSPNNNSETIPEPPPFLLKSAAASPEVNPEIDNKPDTARVTHTDSDADVDANQRADALGRVEPEFKLDSEQAPVEPAKPISLAAQARKLVTRRKKSVADVIRKEPEVHSASKLNEEQMRIDFSNEDMEPVTSNATASTPTTTQQPTASAQTQSSNAGEQATDVLVLNVRAPEDREITGAALLPMLLTLGLKFGEQDIFHRHVNTNGKGPVLFSLANLFKPGVFDIDNIETFSTRGLSLFMMLPIEGDPQQVFNMMHNAARKLAEEFNCQILDGSRGVLTKQGLQKYSERIRDFERKRINR